MAYSYYARPRFTQDVDVLFLRSSEIPTTVAGFRKTDPGSFQHIETGVGVDTFTPAMIGAPDELVRVIFEFATSDDGLGIASASGLVALKLLRLSFQDQADIVALVKTGRIDLSSFPLPPDKLVAYGDLEEAAKTDPHP